MNRNKKGQFIKTPTAKFKHNEFVATKSKLFRRFTRLIEPNYNQKRGWIYGESYTDLQGNTGGSGFWTEEIFFDKLKNPLLKLYATRINLKEEIKEHKLQLALKTKKLNSIEYALRISVDNWDTVKKSCIECGNLFTRNSINVNLDICDECDGSKDL